MSKGDTEHAAKHQHGVVVRPEPPAPLTVEQRLAALEVEVTRLKQFVDSPVASVDVA